MARIRTIKPDFFTSLTVAELPRDVRLTFVGLWTHCDDEGRCIADPRLIKAAIWPLDDDITPHDVEGHLEALDGKLITRYEVAGRVYLQVNGWHEHQSISKPKTSILPPPDHPDRTRPGTVPDTSRNSPGALLAGKEWKGKEGNRDTATPVATATAPEPSRTRPDTTADPQQLLAEHIDAHPRRPPDRVIGHLAREIRALADEGWNATAIRDGLTVIRERGLHPSTLASCVNEAANAPARASPNGTPERLTAAEQRTQRTRQNIANALAKQRQKGANP